MIEQGEILTLSDNNKYVVVSSVIYQDKNYVYLINQNDFSKTMTCLYDNSGLVEVTNPELISILIKLFLN